VNLSWLAEIHDVSERWFIPPYIPVVFPHDYGSSAWGSYFVDSTVLNSVMPFFDVWQTWPYSFFGTTPYPSNWPANLYRILAAHKKNICFSGGDIRDLTTMSGRVAAANDNANVAKILTTGATVDYIVIDGFPISLFSNGFTQAQANVELLNYMRAVHTAYSTIKIGLDVNFPNWAYQGSPNYFGALTPLTDYDVCLESMLAAVRDAGEKIWFIQCDNPYDYSSGIHPALGANVINVDFMARIVTLSKQVQSHGIPFGLMLNSEKPGTDGDDITYYYETLAQQASYAAHGGISDQEVVISWYQGPTAMLPLSQSFTFSNLYAAIVNGQPATANIPVWRLYQPETGFLYTIDMNERNAAMRGGWSLNGIAYWVPPNAFGH
jgi:hypothetical protein